VITQKLVNIYFKDDMRRNAIYHALRSVKNGDPIADMWKHWVKAEEFIRTLKNDKQSNGKALEVIIRDALLKFGISPDRILPNHRMMPSHHADVDLYIKGAAVPYFLHSKTSLRERWKQDDNCALIASYANVSRESYLIFAREFRGESLEATVRVAKRKNSESSALTIVSIRELDYITQLFERIKNDVCGNQGDQRGTFQPRCKPVLNGRNGDSRRNLRQRGFLEED